MPDRTGGAQGDEVAGKNETAVAGGCTGTDGFPLKQANLFSGFGQVIGTGQSDNAAADYQNIAMFFHGAAKSPADKIACLQCSCFYGPYEKGAGVSTQTRRWNRG